MKPRRRALLMLAGAVLCAGLAAIIAARVERRVSAGYGPLEPVLVVSSQLSAGNPLSNADVRESVVRRRVPRVFIPPGTLFDTAGLMGRQPVIDLPAGTYLQEHLLGPSGSSRSPLGTEGRRPVEVSVLGAGALTLGEGLAGGIPVDVVVSNQPEIGSVRGGRASIVAHAVPLLKLSRPEGPGEAWKATLAVSGPQALRLIAAESAGRAIRLLPLKIAVG